MRSGRKRSGGRENVLALIAISGLLCVGASGEPRINPLPRLPRNQCVLDEPRLLQTKTTATLQKTCAALSTAGTGQIVIAIVSDLRGRASIQEFALEFFREIRLGHVERDDGVLVVFQPGPPGHNRVRVTVGIGLESGMTSERLGTVINEAFAPRIKQQDPDGALLGLTDKLVSMVEEEQRSGRVDQHARLRRQQH